MIRALFYVLMFQSQLLWSNNEVDDWDLDTVQTRLYTYEVSLWVAGFENNDYDWKFTGKPKVDIISNSWGISTFPNCLPLAFPFFCLSNNFLFLSLAPPP